MNLASFHYLQSRNEFESQWSWTKKFESSEKKTNIQTTNEKIWEKSRKVSREKHTSVIKKAAWKTKTICDMKIEINTKKYSLRKFSWKLKNNFINLYFHTREIDWMNLKIFMILFLLFFVGKTVEVSWWHFLWRYLKNLDELCKACPLQPLRNGFF